METSIPKIKKYCETAFPTNGRAEHDDAAYINRSIAHNTITDFLEWERRQYQVWTEMVDCNPPDKTEVLFAGYAYNEKRRGYWYRVGYYEGGMYFDNDDFDPWMGWPPVFWTNLPSPPNVA